ncbi:MAG TPA: hypothetical protein VF788_12905 [Pseudonocardiaceae bacterium]
MALRQSDLSFRRPPATGPLGRYPGRTLTGKSIAASRTHQIDHTMLAIGYQPGDLVAIVGGSPPTTEDCTNLIRIHRLGEEDFR